MRAKGLLIVLLLATAAGAVAWSIAATNRTVLEREGLTLDPLGPAPELAIKAGDKTVSVSQMRGKVLLVDFWATYCGPCRVSIPAVERLYAAYHPRGFEVMGVSLDDNQEAMAAFIRDMQMPYPVGRYVSVEMVAEYGAKNIPLMVLIDKKGQVRLFQTGYPDDPDQQAQVNTKLSKAVERLLAE